MENKNSEKLYDMRKIHVCVLEKQGPVIPERSEEIMFGTKTTYKWEYEQEGIILCVKTLGGFKHILTGEVYYIASDKTGESEVIDLEQHMPLVVYDEKLVEGILDETGSYKINLDKVKELEDLLDADFRKEDDLQV